MNPRVFSVIAIHSDPGATCGEREWYVVAATQMLTTVVSFHKRQNFVLNLAQPVLADLISLAADMRFHDGMLHVW